MSMDMGYDPLAGNPKYEKVKDISRGSSGVVLLAKIKNTGELVALKLIERGVKITKSVEREILNHKKLEHPHVVSLIGVSRTETYLVLILEYAAGGSLRKKIASQHRLPEDEARRLFQQLMLAIDYCHGMGVSNRDIKPDNILLDGEGNVLLADFGYSKDEDGQSVANTRLGTPAYTAPEIFKLADGPSMSYDPKQADVFSCGVTLFEMVVGTVPFRRPEDSQQRQAIQTKNLIERLIRGDYSFPSDVPLSEDLKDLIKGMLEKDPKARLTVRAVMKHPWFKKGNLPQGALMINNMLVQESKQNPPDDQEIESIKAIVLEAQQVVKPAPPAASVQRLHDQPSLATQSFLSEEYL